MPRWKGLLRLVKDQVEEGSAVVIVLSKESAMWREESMKTPLHKAQLKDVDVGEPRVVTNSRCKNDTVEKVVMDGPKVVEDEVMDGRRTGKFGKVVEDEVMN